MKAIVELEINCCDDCPFFYYSNYSDVCILMDEDIQYPDFLKKISDKCPLVYNTPIKYSNITVIK